MVDRGGGAGRSFKKILSRERSPVSPEPLVRVLISIFEILYDKLYEEQSF